MRMLRIRYYREKAGMSREELAEKVGISRETLFDYEMGYRSPPLSTFAEIAEALGVSMTDLLREGTLPDDVQQ